MSAFEIASWNWYQGNISRFTLDGGLLPMLIQETGLVGVVRGLFLRALGMIHNAFISISNMATQKEADNGRH